MTGIALIDLRYCNSFILNQLLAGEYMELPASQYSVLDAKRIERIDDDTFRCFVGGINFLSFKAGRFCCQWHAVREHTYVF